MTKPTNPIVKEALVRMRATLASWPPKEKTTFTNREAVVELAAEILHASKTLGYSVEEVAKMLCDLGIEIKPGTLRGYLRDLEKTATAKKTRRRSKASADMAAASPGQTDSGIDRERSAASVAAMSSGSDG